MTLIFPLAQDVLEKPGPHEVHNRVRKAMIIAFDLFWRRGTTLTNSQIESLTRTDFTEAAKNAFNRGPNGPETDAAVLVFLRAINTVRAADGQNVHTSRGGLPKVNAAHHIFPLAQEVLGRSGAHALHNRIRKAMGIAFDLSWRYGEQLTNARIAQLTRADFAAAATNANVEAPTSEQTDAAIVVFLRAINTVRAANGQDVEGPAAVATTPPTSVRADQLDAAASAVAFGEPGTREAALDEFSDLLATDDTLRDLFVRITFGR